MSKRAATPKPTAARAVLSVSEVASKLGVSGRHVQNLIEEGKLRAINIGSDSASGRKFYRIPVNWFEDYLRQQAV